MGYTGEAKKQYQLEWMRKRRDEWIQQNGPCRNCGSTLDLEVDHINPSTKSLPPSRVWSLTKEKREAELAKCQVLCRICHLEKSRKEHPSGERAGAAKLSDEDLNTIRRLHADGTTTKTLSDQFHVHIRTIQSIVYGRRDVKRPRYLPL